MPWAKAGIIVTASTRPGATYAAMMVTQSHGVRMQYDYTGDTAGPPGAVSGATPRWLRLARAGTTVTGYDSADGVHWAKVGSVRLPGLASTVRAGLFAAAPGWETESTNLGGGESGQGGPSLATAALDRVQPRGAGVRASGRARSSAATAWPRPVTTRPPGVSRSADRATSGRWSRATAAGNRPSSGTWSARSPG